jgi:hypothetical protein
MILTWKKLKYTQALDYDKFKCRVCHLLGHLKNTCPCAQAHPPKKKGTKLKPKRWNFLEDLSSNTDIDQNEVN